MEAEKHSSCGGGNQLGFMFRRCSCVPDSMAYWLTVPEFVKEIESLKDKVFICDEVVLPIMQRIYDQKLIEKRVARKEGRKMEFSFGLAKSGIRKIRKALEHQ